MSSKNIIEKYANSKTRMMLYQNAFKKKGYQKQKLKNEMHASLY